MPRRKRTIEETWYDVFVDADSSDQQIMLRTLEQLHRQARRGRLEPKPKNGAGQQAALLEEPQQ